ncbi:Uncharacterised protein [Chlamydia trachomatis]|nr:Uncharacterised protein [Chlamydia trachomatis]CRH48169.1 Uncharacterised protein [Chlamydia trachomatis]
MKYTFFSAPIRCPPTSTESNSSSTVTKGPAATLPLTVTDPAKMISSHFLREATPADAKNLLRRTFAMPVLLSFDCLIF